LATSRVSVALGSLVLAQAAHSVEEYLGHLWEVWPPARLVAGLVSSNLEHGFVVANILLVAFGVWCTLWPVARSWSVAVPLAWFWVVLEALNGGGHVLWASVAGGYRPGLLTAPLLLTLAVYLGYQLNLRQKR
jgi:hypothetical protein